MNQPPVTSKVATMLVRNTLAGLKGFPIRPEGESLLVAIVQKAALSIEHAEAFLSQFDDECPSPREIKDAAWNIRENYLQPEQPQKEKWKAEGYDYDPSYYEKIAAQFAGERKPGQRTMDEEMWAAIKKRLKVTNFAKVPIGQCWYAAQELGFPLNTYQKEDLVRWLATQGGREKLPPLPEKRAIQGKTITWEDVQEAQRQREETQKNLKQLDEGTEETTT